MCHTCPPSTAHTGSSRRVPPLPRLQPRHRQAVGRGRDHGWRALGVRAPLPLRYRGSTRCPVWSASASADVEGFMAAARGPTPLPQQPGPALRAHALPLAHDPGRAYLERQRDWVHPTAKAHGPPAPLHGDCKGVRALETPHARLPRHPVLQGSLATPLLDVGAASARGHRLSQYIPRTRLSLPRARVHGSLNCQDVSVISASRHAPPHIVDCIDASPVRSHLDADGLALMHPLQRDVALVVVAGTGLGSGSETALVNRDRPGHWDRQRATHSPGAHAEAMGRGSSEHGGRDVVFLKIHDFL